MLPADSRPDLRGIDPVLPEEPEICFPSVPRPLCPLLERGLPARLGLLVVPAVDGGQMRESLVAAPLPHGQLHVLNLVTREAQRDQARQALDTALVVVLPDLVAME